MNPHRSIAALGFRRWYERQRFEGQASLVACFLCVVLLAAYIELALPAAGVPRVAAGLVAALAGAAGSLWSWNHYRLVFNRAERYGQVAHCEHCGTYARFDVEPSSAAWQVDEPVLKVRCRQCRHRWTMPDA